MRARGFTLVELMVTIGIIAILAGLLLPVLFVATLAANNARVASEEQNMHSALADFKNQHGEYPPSRIILWNLKVGTPAPYGPSATAVAAGDITFGDLNARTVRAMRKYWPRAGAYFPTSGKSTVAQTWSAAAGAKGYIILQGDECLVFFLGGMPQPAAAAGGIVTSGFNRDPVNPFTFVDINAPESSRTAANYEFIPKRLVDLDGDGFPSYVDPLSASNAPADQRPFAYFSAYGNNGYDPNDFNTSEVDSNGAAVSRLFFVNYAINDGTRVAASAAPNPYTYGDADPVAPQANASWMNSSTYQIISSGRDGLWGLGGAYNPDGSVRLPVGFPRDPGNAAVVRLTERDNIANFSAGKLE